MKDSFIFYRSFYEALSELPDEQQLSIFKAITEMALNGIELDLKGIEKALFVLIKPQLKANNERFENGKKGGRPKEKEEKTELENNQEITKEKPSANQEPTKPKPNDNQTITKSKPNLNQEVTKSKPSTNQVLTKSKPNVNVNVNDNVNVNKNDNENVNENVNVNVLPPPTSVGSIGIFQKFANNNKELEVALLEFEKMRKKAKKPMTDRAKELFTKELVNLSTDSKEQIKLIENAILHNWQTVYKPNGNGFNKPNSKPKNDKTSYNVDDNFKLSWGIVNG